MQMKNYEVILTKYKALRSEISQDDDWIPPEYHKSIQGFSLDLTSLPFDRTRLSHLQNEFLNKFSNFILSVEPNNENTSARESSYQKELVELLVCVCESDLRQKWQPNNFKEEQTHDDTDSDPDLRKAVEYLARSYYSGRLNQTQLELQLTQIPCFINLQSKKPTKTLLYEKLNKICQLIAQQSADEINESARVLVHFALLTGDVAYLIRAVHLLLTDQQQHLRGDELLKLAKNSDKKVSAVIVRKVSQSSKTLKLQFGSTTYYQSCRTIECYKEGVKSEFDLPPEIQGDEFSMTNFEFKSDSHTLIFVDKKGNIAGRDLPENFYLLTQLREVIVPEIVAIKLWKNGDKIYFTFVTKDSIVTTEIKTEQSGQNIYNDQLYEENKEEASQSGTNSYQVNAEIYPCRSQIEMIGHDYCHYTIEHVFLEDSNVQTQIKQEEDRYYKQIMSHSDLTAAQSQKSLHLTSIAQAVFLLELLLKCGTEYELQSKWLNISSAHEFYFFSLKNLLLELERQSDKFIISMLHENICANLNAAALKNFILTDFPINFHCDVYPDAWTHYARHFRQPIIQFRGDFPRYRFRQLIISEIIGLANGTLKNPEILWEQLIKCERLDYLKVLMTSLQVQSCSLSPNTYNILHSLYANADGRIQDQKLIETLNFIYLDQATRLMNDPGIEGLIQCELQEASDIYKILIDEENKSNALIEQIIQELQKTNNLIQSIGQELNNTRVVFAAILKHEHSNCLDQVLQQLRDKREIHNFKPFIRLQKVWNQTCNDLHTQDQNLKQQIIEKAKILVGLKPLNLHRTTQTIFRTLCDPKIQPIHIIRQVTKTTTLTHLRSVPVTTTSNTIKVISSLRPIAAKLISSRNPSESVVFHEIIKNLSNELRTSACVQNTSALLDCFTWKYNNADLKTIHRSNNNEIFKLLSTGYTPDCVLAKNWRSVLTPSAPLQKKVIDTFTTVYTQTLAAVTSEIKQKSDLIKSLIQGHNIVMDVFQTYLDAKRKLISLIDSNYLKQFATLKSLQQKTDLINEIISSGVQTTLRTPLVVFKETTLSWRLQKLDPLLFDEVIRLKMQNEHLQDVLHFLQMTNEDLRRSNLCEVIQNSTVNFLVIHLLPSLQRIQSREWPDLWKTIQEVVVLQASHIPKEQFERILVTFENVGYNSDVIKQLIERNNIVETFVKSTESPSLTHFINCVQSTLNQPRANQHFQQLITTQTLTTMLTTVINITTESTRLQILKVIEDLIMAGVTVPNNLPKIEVSHSLGSDTADYLFYFALNKCNSFKEIQAAVRCLQSLAEVNLQIMLDNFLTLSHKQQLICLMILNKNCSDSIYQDFYSSELHLNTSQTPQQTPTRTTQIHTQSRNHPSQYAKLSKEVVEQLVKSPEPAIKLMVTNLLIARPTEYSDVLKQQQQYLQNEVRKLESAMEQSKIDELEVNFAKQIFEKSSTESQNQIETILSQKQLQLLFACYKYDDQLNFDEQVLLIQQLQQFYDQKKKYNAQNSYKKQCLTKRWLQILNQMPQKLQKKIIEAQFIKNEYSSIKILSSLIITQFITLGPEYANSIIDAALQIWLQNPKATIIIERVIYHIKNSLSLQVYEQILSNQILQEFIRNNNKLWIAQKLDLLLKQTCAHFKQLGVICTEYAVISDTTLFQSFQKYESTVSQSGEMFIPTDSQKQTISFDNWHEILPGTALKFDIAEGLILLALSDEKKINSNTIFKLIDKKNSVVSIQASGARQFASLVDSSSYIVCFNDQFEINQVITLLSNDEIEIYCVQIIVDHEEKLYKFFKDQQNLYVIREDDTFSQIDGIPNSYKVERIEWLDSIESFAIYFQNDKGSIVGILTIQQLKDKSIGPKIKLIKGSHYNLLKFVPIEESFFGFYYRHLIRFMLKADKISSDDTIELTRKDLNFQDEAELSIIARAANAHSICLNNSACFIVEEFCENENITKSKAYLIQLNTEQSETLLDEKEFKKIVSGQNQCYAIDIVEQSVWRLTDKCEKVVYHSDFKATDLEILMTEKNIPVILITLTNGDVNCYSDQDVNQAYLEQLRKFYLFSKRRVENAGQVVIKASECVMLVKQTKTAIEAVQISQADQARLLMEEEYSKLTLGLVDFVQGEHPSSELLQKYLNFVDQFDISQIKLIEKVSDLKNIEQLPVLEILPQESVFEQLFAQKDKIFQNIGRPFDVMGEESQETSFASNLAEACKEIQESYFKNGHPNVALNSVADLERFEFIGKMIGWALQQENYHLSFTINQLFWRKICIHQNTQGQLEQGEIKNFAELQNVDVIYNALIRGVKLVANYKVLNLISSKSGPRLAFNQNIKIIIQKKALKGLKWISAFEGNQPDYDYYYYPEKENYSWENPIVGLTLYQMYYLSFQIVMQDRSRSKAPDDKQRQNDQLDKVIPDGSTISKVQMMSCGKSYRLMGLNFIDKYGNILCSFGLIDDVNVRNSCKIKEFSLNEDERIVGFKSLKVDHQVAEHYYFQFVIGQMQ